MNTETIRGIKITFTPNDVAPHTWHAHLHLSGGVATTSQRLFRGDATWRESWQQLIDCDVGPTEERRLMGIEGSDRPWWPAPDGTRWVRCNKPRGWRWQPVDLGVANLVEDLQRERGPTTTASCDGTHGDMPAHVLLADGRALLVCESTAQFEDIAQYVRVQDSVIPGLFGEHRQTKKGDIGDV